MPISENLRVEKPFLTQPAALAAYGHLPSAETFLYLGRSYRLTSDRRQHPYPLGVSDLVCSPIPTALTPTPWT